MATLPSEKELGNPGVKEFILKYYKTKEDVDPIERIRMGRLIENMTGATPIIECMHGTGSPQTQKVVVQRTVDWKAKVALAQKIAHSAPFAE